MFFNKSQSSLNFRKIASKDDFSKKASEKKEFFRVLIFSEKREEIMSSRLSGGCFNDGMA